MTGFTGTAAAMFDKLTGSLRNRMIVLFGLVVLLGCLVLGLVSNSRAGGVLEGEARDALFQLVQQAAQTQESRIQGRLYTVESIANRNVLRGQSSSGKGEASLEEKLKALRDEKQRTASLGFRDFGIADRDGKATFADGHTASIADRDYFRVALGGKVAVSSTIISRGDGSVVFAYATPIRHYATNQINGVLFGLVDAGRFSQLVAGLHYGRSGYAFAVDSTGKTIAHKDTSRVTGQENTVVKASSDASLAPLARIVSKMARGEQGVASYTFQGQEWTIAYTPIKSTGWSLAVTAPRSEVLGKIAGLRYSMLILSIIIILVALLLTYVMAESVTRPLVRAVNFLGVVAAGDFTGKVSGKWLHRKDEIGMLARAVDGLQAGIRSLLTELQEGARSLSSDSESLGAASQEIAASSNEVAQAIQQVAAGTTGQAGHLQEIHRLTGDIASSLEKVQQELQNVKRSSETASRLAGAGKEELDALVGSINEVHRSFATVIGKLNGLEGSVNQVGQILEVINDITDQTNLLALNAAIEAARAGEAGRGFAVVAEEVRKLAEQSRTSSDQIKQLLGSIASGTGEVVTTSQEVDRQVDAQLEKVSNTVKSFDAILAAVADISPAIEGTYKQLENTVTAKDVVVDRVQSISAAAEQTSAAAEQISASAEELSSSTEEIAANAQDVLGVAKKAEEQVERFKL